MTGKELIVKIESAFAGVELEDGIGLYEGQGLDDRLSERECARLRQKDEKKDWHNIRLSDLYICSSSLSFFDAKGWRFHMPQLLLYGLGVFDEEEKNLLEEGTVKHCISPDPDFHLTYSARGDMFGSYFSALNRDQVSCVIEYLTFIWENNPDDPWTYKPINRALPIWRKRLEEFET